MKRLGRLSGAVLLSSLLISCSLGSLISTTSQGGSASNAVSCKRNSFPPNFDFASWGAKTEGCYLAELGALEEYRRRSNQPDDEFEIDSRITELRAMMGDHGVAHSQRKHAEPTSREIATLLGDPSIERRDAVAAIVDLASTHRVVVINEAHYMSRHRMFARHLIEQLSRRGFRYLAAEAFNPEVDSFNESVAMGVPTHATGWYVRDPVFGNLVRRALELNYKLVPYELTRKEMDEAVSSGDFQRRREYGQAANILARVFETDSQAKAVILVGFDHVKEGARSGDDLKTRRMASYLRDLLGEEILTVDQIAGDLSGSTDFGPLCSDGGGKKALVLKSGGKIVTLGHLAGLIDASVVYGCSRSVSGRPAWLREAGRVRDLFPACKELDPRSRVLAQAYLKHDPPDAIPLDQILIEGGDSRRPLLVPAGKSVRVECRAD